MKMKGSDLKASLNRILLCFAAQSVKSRDRKAKAKRKKRGEIDHHIFDVIRCESVDLILLVLLSCTVDLILCLRSLLYEAQKQALAKTQIFGDL